MLPVWGLAACAHATGTPGPTPSARLVQKLVERENAIASYNGYLIEQASIFASPPTGFRVSRVECAPQAERRFDCRFALATTVGRETRREAGQRIVWQPTETGWTSNIIEELCAEQKRELKTADCAGIVDE
jgi:hypothetical protein